MPRGRPRRFDRKESVEMRRYREAGVSIRHLAAMWDTSEATIMRELGKLRRILGPEKIPNGKRTRWNLFARNLSDMGIQSDSNNAS